jgi:hypothetical protein|tara:strand:- start:86 stop:472 length:387 start_codon:yes stop_codon:yes gene_type:complete
MSLIDLKKSNDRKAKRKKVTVDEFIADAENYAVGKPKVVSSEKINVGQAIISQDEAGEIDWPKHQSKKAKLTKRHATFSLSEDAIVQLNLLSKESKLAKSHIIRILVNECCHEDQQKKLARLLKSSID